MIQNMKPILARLAGTVAALALSGCVAAAQASDQASIEASVHTASTDDCTPANGLVFICGAHHVEDLAPIPGTDLVVGSSRMASGSPRGSLLLFDATTRAVTTLKFDVSGAPLAEYSACPGPLDIANFDPHGLAVKEIAGGNPVAFVVGHGARESVEMFEIDAVASPATARWIGCVMMPEGASGNSVVPLADGGFFVTKFFSITNDGPSFPEQMLTEAETGLGRRLINAEPQAH